MSTYLPLDDRPPNLLMVVLLAALAGQPLCLWDRYQGVEAKVNPPAKPMAGLATVQVPEADGVPLVCLNTLAAGGLVGSRGIDPALLEIPSLPADGLYLFVVPRVEPTVRDSSGRFQYGEVRRQLSDPTVQLQAIAVLEGRAEEKSLPWGPIREWVRRTHDWLAWIESLELPRDRLLILFDDNRYGPLSRFVRERYGWFSEHVIDGADEGGMLLYARSLREASGVRPRVAVMYTAPGNARALGRYEGLPLDEVLQEQAQWLGLDLVHITDIERGMPVLVIHNWIVKQGDRHNPDNWNPNPIPPDVADLVTRLEGHPVYMADIAYANGGDPAVALPLLAAFQDGAVDLRGYAGWNTAANTLGCTLATLAVDQVTPESPAKRELRGELVRARVVDDVLYQSDLRQTLERRLRAEHNDIWQLTRADVEWLEAEATQQLRSGIRSQGFLDFTAEWRLALPWNRTFEAEITSSRLRRAYREGMTCPP